MADTYGVPFVSNPILCEIIRKVQVFRSTGAGFSKYFVIDGTYGTRYLLNM